MMCILHDYLLLISSVLWGEFPLELCICNANMRCIRQTTMVEAHLITMMCTCNI